MPLSEHEQKILDELEDSLARQDPQFAERVASESVYSHAGRYMKWSAAGFVLGALVLLFFFSSSIWLGLLGVAVMFACAVIFEQNLRRLGKAGWADFRRSLHEHEPPKAANPIENTVHSARDWVREHLFRRDH